MLVAHPVKFRQCFGGLARRCWSLVSTSSVDAPLSQTVRSRKPQSARHINLAFPTLLVSTRPTCWRSAATGLSFTASLTYGSAVAGSGTYWQPGIWLPGGFVGRRRREAVEPVGVPAPRWQLTARGVTLVGLGVSRVRQVEPVWVAVVGGRSACRAGHRSPAGERRHPGFRGVAAELSVRSSHSA